LQTGKESLPGFFLKASVNHFSLSDLPVLPLKLTGIYEEQIFGDRTYCFLLPVADTLQQQK
jgi:hypothetical protein